MTSPVFLTIEQLGDALGVGKATIYQWTAQAGPESIPRVRLGKRYGFDLQDVIQWLKTQQDPRLQRPPARARQLPQRIRRRPERVRVNGATQEVSR